MFNVERLAYENFRKYGGDDYKTHAKAEAIADYCVCEDYEKDKAVFAEIYQLLQPLYDKDVLDDYDFDRGFDGKYNPELSMNFDIDECNRAVFNNTSDAVVKGGRFISRITQGTVFCK